MSPETAHHSVLDWTALEFSFGSLRRSPCVFVFAIFNCTKAGCKQRLQGPVPSLTFPCVFSLVGDRAGGVLLCLAQHLQAPLRAQSRKDKGWSEEIRKGRKSLWPAFPQSMLNALRLRHAPSCSNSFHADVRFGKDGPSEEMGACLFIRQLQVIYAYLNDESGASLIHNDVFPYQGKI